MLQALCNTSCYTWFKATASPTAQIGTEARGLVQWIHLLKVVLDIRLTVEMFELANIELATSGL